MLIRIRPLAAFAVAVVCSISAVPADGPPNVNAKDVATGEALITPQKLKMHLSYIASDELAGRGTPSPGQDAAAKYVATRMEYYGYQPAGDDGTFFQKIWITKRKPSKDSSLTVSVGDKQEEFKLGTDFLAPGQGQFQLGMFADAKGKFVFAGFGAVSKELGYDDYAGLDVKDKLVVVFDGYPDGLDANQFKIEQKVGNQTRKFHVNKYVTAKEHGAVGAVIIKAPDWTAPRGENKPSPFEAALAVLQREVQIFEGLQVIPTAPIEIHLTASSAERLGKALGVDFAAQRAKIVENKKPEPVAIDASFETVFKQDVTEKKSTQNVVAFLEGSDPELKSEILAFGAHIDHLGTATAPGRGVAGALGGGKTRDDVIWNGADDDGSGTVGILTLAEAYAAVTRPKRSLLFVWHTGEELGLYGSSYFTNHPTKPIDKIVTLLNIDMIGRNLDDKDENINHMYLVGAAKTSRDLKEIVYQVVGNRMRLDETDPKAYFFRSDHINYARKRIPIVFFCTGEHKDYHKASDEVQFILFDKMKQILDIVFETGLEVANRPTRPEFTGQGI